MKFTRKSSQLGQGMTEYIIIVALIGIAAIGMFGRYGDTVVAQGSAITNELAAQSGEALIDRAGAAATAAALNGQVRPSIGLKNYDDNGATED